MELLLIFIVIAFLCGSPSAKSEIGPSKKLRIKKGPHYINPWCRTEGTKKHR